MSKYNEWPLTKFTEDVFLGILKVDYKPASKTMTRKAVSVFRDWYGGEPLISDITPAMIAEMQSEKEMSPIKNGHINALRTIMRTADPLRFSKPTPAKMKLPAGMDGPVYLLAAFYSELYEPLALRSRRPNTKRLYLTTLVKFEEFLKRPPTLDDLEDSVVGKFAAARLDAGKAKHTVNKDLFNLLAIWRWANRKGYVDTWPDVQMESAPKRIPQAWTEVEIGRLFKSAKEEKGRIAGIPGGLWWTTILLVAWDTGERIAAIRGVCWADIDFDWCGVKFTAENRKGALEDNLRAVAKDTILGLERIKAWQESHEMYEPDGLVFVFPYCTATLYDRFNRILDRADLPNDCKCKFHRIRRSVASHFEQAGGNATELLGHSKREVTKAYLDPKIVKRTEAVDLLFRPGGPRN